MLAHQPRIKRVDTVNGLVEFDWTIGGTRGSSAVVVKPLIPSVWTIEVYKYTRYCAGEHRRQSDQKVYEEHHGKRYKPFLCLERGSTWTVPTQFFRNLKHNYFKFAYYDITTKQRGGLTGETIKTVRLVDSTKVNAKIFLV